MKPRTGAALLAALLLAGCALGPPPLPESPPLIGAPVAPSAHAPEAGWPVPQWWRGYADPTLDGLVEHALAGAPGMESAAARFGTARENVRLAGAAAGLRLDGEASYQRLRLSENGLLPTDLLGFTQYGQADIGVRARFDFDWWGRKRAMLDAARDHAFASAAEVQLASLSLAAAIAESYFGWQADTARLGLLDERLAALARLRHIAARREAAGLDRGDDAEQARLAEAAHREQRAQLEGSRQLRRVQVAALLGVAPDALPAFEPRSLPAATGRWPAGAGLDLVARRPDVAANRWRVEASRRDLDVVRTEYYPDLSINALAGLSSIDPGRLFQAASAAPSVGLALHLPLYDGLRDARHGVATAQLASAIARYNESVVEAAREVGASAAALAQARAQLVERGLVLRAADESLRMATARAGAGLTDARPGIQAHLALLREQDARVVLDHAALVADIQLQEALGGGYLPSPETP